MQTTVIEVPMVPLTEGEYAARHIDVRLIGDEARVFRSFVKGLQEQHAQLACKRHVDTNAHAIRWICQQLLANETSQPEKSGSGTSVATLPKKK